MKYQPFLFLVLFCLASGVFAGTTKEPSTQKIHQAILTDYKPEKVADHTYVIHGPDRMNLKENQAFVNNPAFIIGDKSVIVIDPGSSVQIGRALLQHIRTLTDKPVTHVFNTHIHGDHWLGNHAFVEENPTVVIYAHPEMIQEAKSGEAKKWLDIFMSITEGAIKGTEVVIPNKALKDQQLITINDITIKAHLSEWAHTKTDVMLEVVEDKVLFTGDTVNNQRIVPFNEGSFTGSIKAISKAIALDIKTVVPGHGPTGEKSLLINYQAGLEAIYNAVKKMADEGLESYEMKEKVLASNAAFKNWLGFEQEIGRYLNLAVLEIEQEDF